MAVQNLTFKQPSILSRGTLPWIVMALLPAVLLHWMLPFVSDVGPGRSFMRYSMWFQKEMMYALKTGTFPLFMPTSFGGMQSSVVAGVGQMFLPIPYVASMLPGYWAGNGSEWNLLLLLMMIPVGHMMLFAFLKRLNIHVLPAFFLSTITIYAPRLLTSISYGPGIGIWVGQIFLCAVIGLYCLQPVGWKRPLCIIGAVYWIINSGIPGETFYALLGTVLFTFYVPFLIRALCPAKAPAFSKTLWFWAQTGIYGIAGILLSFAYILPMYLDVVTQVGFGNQGYAWASGRNDSVAGIIANFFSPLRASFMGCFAGSPLYLTAMMIPALKLFRVKVPVVLWCIIVTVVISLLHMMGDLTPVHQFIWEHLPFASSTRVPERISLLLPMLFMLILLWLFSTEQTLPLPFTGGRQRISMTSFTGVVALCLYLVYFVVTARIHTNLFEVARINLELLPGWVEPFTIVNGVLILVLMSLHGLGSRFRPRAEFCLCLLTVLQLAFVLQHAAVPFMAKEAHPALTLETLAARKQKTMAIIPDYLFVGEIMSGRHAIEQIRHYFLEPHTGKLYSHYQCVNTQQQAHDYLNNRRQQDEAVIEACPKARAEKGPTSGGNGKNAVTLIHSSYNRMIFAASASTPGVFVFAPVYDHHWRASLNGHSAKVFRANGASHGVFVPRGNHIIEFRYWSNGAFWGMVVSTLTLMGIGLIIGIRGVQSQRMGYLISTLTLIAGLGLFALWYHSLYNGDSLGTRYEWASPPVDARPNLAYGRQTRMSSLNSRHPFIHHSRRAVDGDPSFQSCFVTDAEENPWWEVDLGSLQTFNEVAVFMQLQGYAHDKMLSYFSDNVALTHESGVLVYKKIPVLFNNTPLTIVVSDDRRNWDGVTVKHTDANSPLRIRFKKPVEARYVRISASGKCRLSLNEVAVYPPGPLHER